MPKADLNVQISQSTLLFMQMQLDRLARTVHILPCNEGEPFERMQNDCIASLWHLEQTVKRQLRKFDEAQNKTQGS